MRAVRNTVAKGFTLVEILIVVVILGILAAIVVPQFTNAANEARGGNVATQESTVESPARALGRPQQRRVPRLHDRRPDLG
jgi:prepilin-type N-terminal cleavage/methylation domain-containing protein